MVPFPSAVEHHALGTIEFRIRTDFATFQRGKGGDHLEGGGGGIEPLNGTGDQRMFGIEVVFVKLRLTHAIGPIVGIVSRIGAHGHHIARFDIHDDKGTPHLILAHLCLYNGLEPRVEGGDDGVTGLGALHPVFGEFISGGVVEHAPRARGTG